VVRSGALAVALLFVTASTVFAAVTKSGTKTCTQNQTAYTHSFSTGLTDASAPGGRNNAEWNNGANWVVRTVYDDPGAGGGTWVVVVYGGSLNDAQTYGACFNGT